LKKRILLLDKYASIVYDTPYLLRRRLRRGE
jgi:hypothetical protein